MSVISGGANYNGKQPNNTSYIKDFVLGDPGQVWAIVTVENTEVASPVSPLKDIYVPGNIYISGQIIPISPLSEPENIHYTTQSMSIEDANTILNINPIKIKHNITKQITYDIENSEQNINSSTLIPLLIKKIQDLQNQINDLDDKLKNLS